MFMMDFHFSYQFFFGAGKIKCERYWPMDKKEIALGGVEITLLSETTQREWVVRKFYVSKVKINNVVLFQTSLSFSTYCILRYGSYLLRDTFKSKKRQVRYKSYSR